MIPLLIAGGLNTVNCDQVPPLHKHYIGAKLQEADVAFAPPVK